MKVGILTFPNSISYGATLQMYALYRAVEKMGHGVEIINYHNAYMKAEKHVTQKTKSRTRAMLRRMLHCRLYGAFRCFEKENMVFYPKKSVDQCGCLPEIAKRFSAVICGSDQVWNPDITDKDLSYFLDFCGESTRRIAYAPSFGVENLAAEFFAQVSEELGKFHAISVREKSGQHLVQQMLNREVTMVVDPTMLLDASDWSAMEQPHSLGRGEYILYYTIRRSESLMRFCRHLSKQTGLKIVVVGGNPLDALRKRDEMVDYAVDISPKQWLFLVHHARYVVTNSFHGTAFSINYRKDFYVEFSSLTNSRLANIVQIFGLQDRVVKEGALENLADVDYSRVAQELPTLQEQSLSYLRNALEAGEICG